VVTISITPDMKSIGIGVSTPEAGEIGIEGLLDAQLRFRWRHFWLLSGSTEGEAEPTMSGRTTGLIQRRRWCVISPM
jgi:hypothetical protein